MDNPVSDSSLVPSLFEITSGKTTQNDIKQEQETELKELSIELVPSQPKDAQLLDLTVELPSSKAEGNYTDIQDKENKKEDLVKGDIEEIPTNDFIYRLMNGLEAPKDGSWGKKVEGKFNEIIKFLKNDADNNKYKINYSAVDLGTPEEYEGEEGKMYHAVPVTYTIQVKVGDIYKEVTIPYLQKTNVESGAAKIAEIQEKVNALNKKIKEIADLKDVEEQKEILENEKTSLLQECSDLYNEYLKDIDCVRDMTFMQHTKNIQVLTHKADENINKLFKESENFRLSTRHTLDESREKIISYGWRVINPSDSGDGSQQKETAKKVDVVFGSKLTAVISAREEFRTNEVENFLRGVGILKDDGKHEFKSYDFNNEFFKKIKPEYSLNPKKIRDIQKIGDNEEVTKLVTSLVVEYLDEYIIRKQGELIKSSVFKDAPVSFEMLQKDIEGAKKCLTNSERNITRVSKRNPLVDLDLNGLTSSEVLLTQNPLYDPNAKKDIDVDSVSDNTSNVENKLEEKKEASVRGLPVLNSINPPTERVGIANNSGSNCFANASMQYLVSSAKWLEKLETACSQNNYDGLRPNQKTALHSLVATVNSMLEEHPDSKTIGNNVNELRENVNELRVKKDVGFGQQDASEFMQIVNELIPGTSFKLEESYEYTDFNGIPDKKDVDCYDFDFDFDSVTPKSINDLIEGRVKLKGYPKQLKKDLECSVSLGSISGENIENMKADDLIKFLEDSRDDHRAFKEVISFAESKKFKCGCKIKGDYLFVNVEIDGEVNYSSKFTIKGNPDFITLKPGYNEKKATDYQRLTDFTDDKISINNNDYKPVSFIVHKGNISGDETYGHYVNYRLTDDGWYCFDDRNESTVADISNVISSQRIYSIFLEKQDNE